MTEEQSLHKLVQNCTDPEKGLKKLDNNWKIRRRKRIPVVPDSCLLFFFGKISDSCLRGCRISYGKNHIKTVCQSFSCQFNSISLNAKTNMSSLNARTNR